ncbi:uncharacterized protein LOC141914057 [Tubulanus polymorphus]|uniref:uncharacterized protein LOC141914057 n=1 Tax=Tubulanus polymorphus TaxID=672921 RepID=UPI003DA661CF
MIGYYANPQATSLNCIHEFIYRTNWFRLDIMCWEVTIESVQASDYGSHSCQLKNSIGSLDIITLDILKTVDDNAWTVTSLVPLIIAGVVLGSIAFILIVIFLLVYPIKQLRNRGNKSRGILV